MRLLHSVVAALAVAQGVMAVDVLKSVLVTFPNDVAADVVDRAMGEIKSAGGVITHQYKLIKGFAANAPQKIIDSVSAWSTSEYNAVIEEDQQVQISQNRG
ncbi:hypothetical protein BX600DRAFT_134743 [Xylariales sp. PMI_506]|nr:hypothetical protein BX600DRAFT_134743 [Xylariales sp. PMI_506]